MNLRGSGRAEPSRRGPVLVANGDDDRPVAERPAPPLTVEPQLLGQIPMT
jgi:hypothetical protein